MANYNGWHGKPWHTMDCEVDHMAIFEDFGKRLSQAAQVVGKRTSEVAELGRLNAKLQSLRQDLDALYIQIGKAFYNERDDERARDAARVFCDHVDTVKGQIESVLRKIDRLKQQRRCEKCGDVQPAKAVFCANCGAKLPDDEPEEEEPEAEPAPSPAPEPQAAEHPEPTVEIHWPGEPDAEPAATPDGEPTPEDKP